ncbi:MAG TPA: zinc-binding dehydrogenase [Thermoplasmata archaeon]|nr:zinc-binding dehydrogenase [Thermoplasmata archaeon]
MKGFGFRAHGGPEQLQFVDIERPVPGPGEVAVRVAAASFNRLDRFVLAGMPGVPVGLPHVLGSDAAGWVAAHGKGANAPDVGRRVLVNPGLWDATCDACRRGQESLCRQFRILGEHIQGSLTETVVVPDRNVHAIPDSLPFAQAAAAPLVLQTAWRALRTVGELQPGETVAIIGAGGGVATSAIQVAKLSGARVVVVSRSVEKLAAARRLGADDGLLLDATHSLDRLLWEWSGKRGVDVIFDSVGQPTVPLSVRALARGGRLVVIGATGGPTVEIDLRPLFWRQSSLRGSTMASRSEFAAMLEQLLAGKLTPVIDRVFDLSEAAQAFQRLDAPDLFGKVVVHVSNPAP